MKRDSKQILTELLVYKSQAGDESAFAELFALWRLDILRLARSVIGSLDAAEDIAQEAWVAIGKGVRRLEDPARFRAWAFCIVRRRCVDRTRHEIRERAKKDSFEEWLNVEADCGSPDRDEDTARLVEAIQKLNTDERMLIHLYYEAELSIGELSESLGIAEGTVKSRLFAVREKLRKQIERIRR